MAGAVSWPRSPWQTKQSPAGDGRALLPFVRSDRSRSATAMLATTRRRKQIGSELVLASALGAGFSFRMD